MRRDIDRAVARLAAPRAGVFTRDELTAVGGNKHLARRRCAAGVWQQCWLDVFTLTSHPHTLDQLRWIAVLAGGDGAHLSFESAAELHRLDGIERQLVVVTTRRGNRIALPGVTFHQLDDVRPSHLVQVDGFPTTTVARTILDLSAVVSAVRLGVALEDAVVRRLVTFGELYGLLGDVRRRGKLGVTNLVGALDGRDGRPPAASTLERHLHRVAAMAGVAIVRQHPLPARAHVSGLVDAAVLESKLILEADGRRWHSRLREMANDRRRDREAARLGWLTLRFVHEDLVHDPAGSADDIRTTHRERTGG